MTIMTLFSVYDSASELYGRPFAAVSSPAAARAFADEVNRPDSEFGKHPDDYTLWAVATFDERTGLVTPQPLATVLRGKDAVIRKE